MVNVTKTQPPPKSLEVEKNKSNGEYNTEEVLNLLKKDFNNKCYICEVKNLTSINVEHFKAHKGNVGLKFDWNNLFLSCSHCNNTKLAKFDDILNCTDINDDVVGFMIYKFDEFSKSKVIVTPIAEKQNDDRVKNTAQLLNLVYNGKTPTKDFEATNLRKLLVTEIYKFKDILAKYLNDDFSDEKEEILADLGKMLSKKSPFTAFKRWIVKEKKLKELEVYFD